MRINFRLQMQCLALAGIAILAGCGGSDGSSSLTSKSAQAPAAASGASEVALAPPAAPVVADTSINKTVPPVELPDTVTPVNYKLWFRPNPALSSF
ncbi:MAG: peptidase M1, partial [Paraburkholderia nemoris]